MKLNRFLPDLSFWVLPWCAAMRPLSGARGLTVVHGSLHLPSTLTSLALFKRTDRPNFLICQRVRYALLDGLIIPRALAEVSHTSSQTKSRSS